MRTARLRKKPASTSTAVSVRLLCRKKEKPRGSASSESVRAGLLPRADLVAIIGFRSDTVNAGQGPLSARRCGQLRACLSTVGNWRSCRLQHEVILRTTENSGKMIVCATDQHVHFRARLLRQVHRGPKPRDV